MQRSHAARCLLQYCLKEQKKITDWLNNGTSIQWITVFPGKQNGIKLLKVI